MRLAVAFSFFAVLLLQSNARATTTEPNGQTVPKDSSGKGGEVQVYTLFSNRGDPVDWLADAHTTPATFSPLCNFQATYVLHQAGSSPSVGWYNVDPAATAPPTDFHVIVPGGSPVGTVVSSATIKNDPAYAGGEIGFVLMTSQPHFSEQKWNVQCTLFCQQAGPWITSVTYQSKNTPNAYYLAFEDGSVSATNFGNDGDFNDDVFFFEGLTCQGGGTPCDTGQPGACAPGMNECSASGISCMPVVQPSAEKCNGLDDDCNGQTDDGDLCQAGFVCDHGTCVARCGGGEFECSRGKTCNKDGFCVDPSCADVSCAAGTVCIDGACKAPCDGIACPSPTVCRAGACVDPCAGVTCETGSVCTGGICVTGCDCNPCATGKACDSASEQCVEPTCVGVTCTGSERCSGGVCVDPCVGAACPGGQACTNGACVPSGVPDGGSSDTDNGGQSPILIGIGTGDTNGVADAAPGNSGGASNGGAASEPEETGTGGRAKRQAASLGCGCRMDKRHPLTSPIVGAALFFLAVERRRRGGGRGSSSI